MFSILILMFNTFVAALPVPNNGSSLWSNYVVKNGSVSSVGKNFLTQETQNCLASLQTTLSIELFQQASMPSRHQLFVWVDSGDNSSFTLNEQIVKSVLECISTSTSVRLSRNSIWSHNSYLMSAPRDENYNVQRHYGIFGHGVTQSSAPSGSSAAHV